MALEKRCVEQQSVPTISPVLFLLF